MIGSIASGAIKTVKGVTSHIPKGTVGAGLNLYFGIEQYKDARKEGDSKLVSMAKSLGTFAMGEMMGLAYFPLMLAPLGVQLAGASATNKLNVVSGGYGQKGKFGSGYFDMSQAGYTMRQRSLNAIQQNGLNLNSALGNEARTYFRSST